MVNGEPKTPPRLGSRRYWVGKFGACPDPRAPFQASFRARHPSRHPFWLFRQALSTMGRLGGLAPPEASPRRGCRRSRGQPRSKLCDFGKGVGGLDFSLYGKHIFSIYPLRSLSLASEIRPEIGLNHPQSGKLSGLEGETFHNNSSRRLPSHAPSQFVSLDLSRTNPS